MWPPEQRKGGMLGYRLRWCVDTSGWEVRGGLGEKLRRLRERAPQNGNGRVLGHCLVVRGERRRDYTQWKILDAIGRIPPRLRDPH